MARPRQFDSNVALDRAIDAFWEGGFDATGVQDLCDSIGINPASLYGAFGDKRDVFIAALERYMERGASQEFAKLRDNPEGFRAIRDFMAALIARRTDPKRPWGCLVVNTAAELAPRDPEIARLIAIHFARLESAFAAALARAQTTGELRAGVGSDAAGYLVCLVQGLNLVSKAKPSRAALEAIVATALDGLACNANGHAEEER